MLLAQGMTEFKSFSLFIVTKTLGEFLSQKFQTFMV